MSIEQPSPKDVLFVTKSRSTYGSHKILTSLIRQSVEDDIGTSVYAWEHPLESARWNIDTYWSDIDDYVEILSPDLTTEVPLQQVNPFIYQDELLKNDEVLRSRLARDVNKFGKVVIDSWYVAHSAYQTDIHTLPGVTQLVQSRPEFIPENKDREWKAELFKTLPMVQARRMFTSKSYMNEYPQGDNYYLGVFVDKAFYNKGHQPKKEIEALELITVVSNPNIKEKGILELLEALKLASEAGAPIKKLTIVTGQSFESKIDIPDFEVKFLENMEINEQADVSCIADAYVTCTTQETPGLAQLEAMALGLPSVAIDSGGNMDYYTGDNFMLVNYGGFTSAIRSILNREVRVRLSNAAKESSKNYTEQAMYQRFKTILEL